MDALKGLALFPTVVLLSSASIPKLQGVSQPGAENSTHPFPASGQGGGSEQLLMGLNQPGENSFGG